MRTAIDTNVISAIWSRESTQAMLIQKLDQAKSEGALVICAPVWAELQAYPGMTLQTMSEFLDDTAIDVDYALSPEVWVRCAQRYKAHAERRRKSQGDSPRRLMTDFVIGAHAWLEADRLLTRDIGFYERNFPELRLL